MTAAFASSQREENRAGAGPDLHVAVADGFPQPLVEQFSGEGPLDLVRPGVHLLDASRRRPRRPPRRPLAERDRTRPRPARSGLAVG